MGSLLLDRPTLPTAPPEIADEVELYARQSGRHGRLLFVPIYRHYGCWTVRLTLRSDDKRMRLYQEGKTKHEPEEVIWLHRPLQRDERPFLASYPYKAFKLEDLGASGVREFLDRGNTFSGRGEFDSVEEAVKRAQVMDQMAADHHRQSVKDEAMAGLRAKRRWYQKIPFLPVTLTKNWHKDAKEATT